MKNNSQIDTWRIIVFIALAILTFWMVFNLPWVAGVGMVISFLLGYMVGWFWCISKPKMLLKDKIKKDDNLKK